LLRLPGATDVFAGIAWLFNGVIEKADAGIAFLFGSELANPVGPVGFVFAIRVLTVIVFFASLISVLYYLNIVQRLIAGLAWMLRRSLQLSSIEALTLSATALLGQNEAPLVVRLLMSPHGCWCRMPALLLHVRAGCN
jgi:CNT family concentrative nucleoside transporter